MNLFKMWLGGMHKIIRSGRAVPAACDTFTASGVFWYFLMSMKVLNVLVLYRRVGPFLFGSQLIPIVPSLFFKNSLLPF